LPPIEQGVGQTPMMRRSQEIAQESVRIDRNGHGTEEWLTQ
jgi:hypothetical protein